MSGIDASPVVLWFRIDLRLADQPALQAALSTGRPILPVFIWEPDEEAPWQPGGASRWWLHHSLAALDADLMKRGSRLILRRGPAEDELHAIVRETGARSIFWNRRYEPVVIQRDARIKASLTQAGCHAESFNGALLVEPWHVQNKSGSPFQVFTPFWKSIVSTLMPPAPTPAPERISAPKRWPDSLPLDALDLLPKIPWDAAFKPHWTPGESGAREALEKFCTATLFNYHEGRNFPDKAGTSRLSPHLHFGEISPRQIWHRSREAAESAGIPESTWRRWQFLSEIGWREFAHHLLFYFPNTPHVPLRPAFERFPWIDDPSHLDAWKKGRTGIPLVDAGMRELWTTGWMHNRVRMIVGSFLVKNLLCSWTHGTHWFWDTLVDADLPNNTLGWQWIAGCGADAAPYFRIFNPVSQGMKFDPNGAYVRRWVPEISALPNAIIHAPWEASPTLLAESGVNLGKQYPKPIVNLAETRTRALAAFVSIKSV